MPAQKRVPDRRVIEVAQKWGGNLTAAAREIGMARQNLRNRLRALGFDVEACRRGALSLNHAKRSGIHQSDRLVSRGSNREMAAGSVQAGGPRGSESDSVIYHKPDGSPIFVTMPEAEMAIDPKPLPKAQLLPEHLKALREAKLDINFKTRADEKEQDILHRFFEEAFADWLKRTLGRERKA